MKKINLILLLMFFLTACTEPPKSSSKISALSISSDGNYAISTHHGTYAVLWDLKSKTKKIISKDANIYSAYFIKDSNNFIWQDIKTDMVHLLNKKGIELKTFIPGFASYGQTLTTDLITHTASDNNKNIYEIQNNHKYILKKGFSKYGYNLSLSLVNNIFLSSVGCDYKGEDLPISAGLAASDRYSWMTPYADYSFMKCITIYDLNKHTAIHKLTGNAGATTTTLSPDGKYIVSGDENSIGLVWRTDSFKKLFKLDSLYSGKDLGLCDDGTHCKWDKTDLIPAPKDFCFEAMSNYCSLNTSIIAIKFINNSQYLRFTTHIKYAILYDVLDPRPKKYLKLESLPQINGYSSSFVIDTAPKVGVLVISSAVHSGLIVYKYDKKTQSLKKTWESTGPLDHGQTREGEIIHYTGNKYKDFIIYLRTQVSLS